MFACLCFACLVLQLHEIVEKLHFFRFGQMLPIMLYYQ